MLQLNPTFPMRSRCLKREPPAHSGLPLLLNGCCNVNESFHKFFLPFCNSYHLVKRSRTSVRVLMCLCMRGYVYAFVCVYVCVCVLHLCYACKMLRQHISGPLSIHIDSFAMIAFLQARIWPKLVTSSCHMCRVPSLLFWQMVQPT